MKNKNEFKIKFGGRLNGARLLLVFSLIFLFSGIPNQQSQAQTVLGDDAPLKFGRFLYEGKERYGFLSSGGIHELDGSYFNKDTKLTGRVIPLDKVKMLVPVKPEKVIGIALNYKSHGGARTKVPGFFSKLPSSLLATNGTIVPPPGSSSLHYEGEMVLVIGKTARNVSVKDAKNHIFGVSVGNDITERGFSFSPFVVIRTKGSDTFSPIAPWIVPGLDYDNLQWTTRLNGKVVQKSSTRKMIFKSAELVSAISKYITLKPGDLIYTGTAGQTRAMSEGDVIEVHLEGVGSVKNTVGKPLQ